MRLLREQYLKKGRRVRYHLALREIDAEPPEPIAPFVITCRWENPYRRGSLEILLSTRSAANAAFAAKVRDLLGRGYRLCRRPGQRGPTIRGPVRSMATDDQERADPALAAVLSERRRTARWAIE